MIKTFGLFFVLLFVFSLNACGSDTVEEVNEHLFRLKSQLNLSEAQQNQIREILTKAYAERDANRESADKNSGDRHSNRAWEKSLHDQIEEVLNDRQKEKYAEVRQSEKGDDQLEQLVKRLSLTDEQTAKVRKFIDIANEDMKLLREEMREGTRGRGEMRNGMQVINDEMDKQIESILSHEQKMEYQKIKTERMKKWGGARGHDRRGQGKGRK